MKKFTFMLLAAFMAVTAWAQPTVVKNHRLLPEQFVAKTATTVKQAPQMKKEMAPRQALKGKVQAPAQRTTKKAKAAPKKAIDINALLSGEPVTFMVKNYAYDIENQGTQEEPDYQLVPANISRVSEFWTVTLDAATMTVSITGVGGGETAVTGTVDPTTMAITIPYGQAVGTTNYGTIGLASATGAENLVGQFTGEAIIFTDYWYTELVDGDYAGESWSYIYESTAVAPNGKMTWVDSKGAEAVADVDIDFDADAYVATVWNFGDEGVAIDVTLKPEGKFVIDPQLIYEGGSTYGDFYTYNADCFTPTISGTGTENTLTFGSEWTCFSSTGYWYGKQGAATITFDGTFVYPEVPDAPATPATPEVTFFDFWNGQSATVTLTVPCVDVDGNDIKGSLLSYQLFTKDDSGAPASLGEPIAYTNEENGTGDAKTVVLGEEAKGLVVIGAKSIYTAGGETNESEIAWFEFPQLVEVPEGLVTTEYPVTADAYSGSWTTYTGTALVGVDGTDVYVKGILPHCPEGWAKGTIAEGVITFPVQCVGTYAGGIYIYLAAYGDAPSPVTFTYNADEDIYTSEDYILANSSADKFGFYYPYFDGMTIGTESIPELVELPEGAEVVEYPFVGTTYSNSESTEFESTVNVAVVGNDVYVQGLNEYVPEAWVKGTKDEATGDIIFPTGQNLGVYEDGTSSYQFFMVGYDANTDAIADVVMTYNEEQDFYRLETDLLVNGKKLSLYYYTWYEAGSIIGTQTEFDVTFNFNEMEVATSSNVTTDGDILETKELTADPVTLAISPKEEGAKTENRFWGTNAGPQLRVYSGTLTFSVPEGNFITGLVFNYGKWNEGNSADSGEFDGATWTGKAQTVVVAIAGNSQINSIDVTYAAKQLPPLVETEAPDDLETSEWKIDATEIVYYEEEVDDETGEVISEEKFVPEKYTANAQVGFYTVEGEEGTEVYIQGLCPELPEAWVKGTLAEDNTVTIPYSTYFGVYEYIDWDAWAMAEDNMFLTAAVINDDNTVTMKDVVFAYDAEAGTLTSNQTIFINADRREINYYHWFEGMTLSEIPDVAATPADPEILEVSLTGNYPYVKYNIPTVDVDGNDLLTGKLAYQVYVKKDEVTPLVLTTDLYEELEDEMSEIPYDFSDDWDVYNYKLYLNQGEEELNTWKRIGIQSIYYGAGERHTSNIVWVRLDVEKIAITNQYTPFSSAYDLNFADSDVKAYIASGFKPENNELILVNVTDVPANTGVLLIGGEGEYDIPKGESSSFYVNLFKPLVQGGQVAPYAEDQSVNFVYAETDGPAFYPVAEAVTLPANSAYLQLPANVGTSVEKVTFLPEDDVIDAVTGIEATDSETIYDLQGRRINKAAKGVFIVNGKKMLVK